MFREEFSKVILVLNKEGSDLAINTTESMLIHLSGGGGDKPVDKMQWDHSLILSIILCGLY